MLQRLLVFLSEIHFPFLFTKLQLHSKQRFTVHKSPLQMELLMINKGADTGWVFLTLKWTIPG